MSSHVYTDSERKATLMIIRVIWLALVVGQVGFGAVVYYSVVTGGGGGQTQIRGQMLAIASGVLIGAVVLGYYVRNQSYKKHWQEHAVAPPGYFMGNIILFAALEGSSFLTLVFVMMSGQLFPMILPAVASLAVQCANFPSAMPMQNTPPGFVRESP